MRGRWCMDSDFDWPLPRSSDDDALVTFLLRSIDPSIVPSIDALELDLHTQQRRAAAIDWRIRRCVAHVAAECWKVPDWPLLRRMRAQQRNAFLGLASNARVLALTEGNRVLWTPKTRHDMQLQTKARGYWLGNLHILALVAGTHRPFQVNRLSQSSLADYLGGVRER